jgi:CRP-like cAMP-binding protein
VIDSTSIFHKLRAFFERSIPITDDQFESIKTLFSARKVKKGHLLLHEGDMTKLDIFVASGCLRTYTIDNSGKEHIIQFSIENWWTGDLGVNSSSPAQCFIEALEDSEILVAESNSIERLIKVIPEMGSFYRAALQRSAAAKNERIVSSLSKTAEERYDDFLKKYPSVIQRVPQHMIASYLGISPETLSRIRQQRSKRR